MARELRILSRARTDLDEIWEYVAQDSFSAANRVENELQQAIWDLVQFPGKGHTRKDIQDKTLRFWTVYSYLIVFRYDDQFLTVVRVIHGARNLGRWLSNT